VTKSGDTSGFRCGLSSASDVVTEKTKLSPASVKKEPLGEGAMRWRAERVASDRRINEDLELAGRAWGAPPHLERHDRR